MSVAPPFGQPVPPPSVQAPEEPPAKGRRTVVVAVAAGVAALGLLGGATALVIGGGEDTDMTAVPPAAADAVPDVGPSTEPSLGTTLFTGAVQGRNVFVPLVVAAGTDTGDGVAGDPTAADPAAAATAVTEPSVGTSGGTSGGTRSSVPAVTGTTTAGDDERVRELQSEIASLTQELVDAGDGDAALRERVAALQSEQDALLAVNAELRAQAEKTARLRTVEFVSVDLAAPGDPLQIRVDGKDVTLDLDPGPAEQADRVPDSVVLGTSGTGEATSLTYRSVDGAVSPGTVGVQVGTATYQVSLGGVLIFTIP